MHKTFKEFAQEAEKIFLREINFQKDRILNKKADKVLNKLESCKIGPRLLLLLAVFSFPKDKREKLWIESQKIFSINK